MKSYAKVNIYLKIVGYKDGYHLINSRFVKVKHLYDTLEFVPKDSTDQDFKLEGSFGCELKHNTIYKTHLLLKEKLKSTKYDNFFKSHKLKVQKNIPEFAGLGGASSNVATFLLLCNQELELKLSKQELMDIGSSIGSDVAFFISKYDSANVSGFGEIVEEFIEHDNITLNIITPKIKCSTAQIYKEFKNKQNDFTKNQNEAQKLQNLSSKQILQTYNIKTLNDLYIPASNLHQNLKKYSKNNFFSGSGSSFFSIKE